MSAGYLDCAERLGGPVIREFAALNRNAENARIATAIRTRAELCSHAQDGREECGLEQLSPVIVDLILETGIPACIGALLTFQDDRTTVRIIRRVHTNNIRDCPNATWLS